MKEYEIFWLPEALEDLDEIFEFIAQKSPIAAEKVIKSILNRPEQLKKYPKSGQQEIFLKEHENVRYL